MLRFKGIFTTIPLFLVLLSCKKDATVHRNQATWYYCFWYDKATSDSLTAHGIDSIALYVPKISYQHTFELYTSRAMYYNTTAPPCNSAQDPNYKLKFWGTPWTDEPEVLSYSIYAYKNSAFWSDTTKINHGVIWSGTVAVEYDGCNRKKLTWP